MDRLIMTPAKSVEGVLAKTRAAKVFLRRYSSMVA
jgi:hypothetical protein